MDLLKLKTSDVWTVYFYVDENGDCPVIDFLESLDDDLQVKMYSLLNEFITVHGPPNNENISKMLHTKGKKPSNTYELKRGAKKGPKLRVIYFYGGKGNVMVCTTAILKRDSISDEVIEANEKLRKKYLEDKKKGKLNIESVSV